MENGLRCFLPPLLLPRPAPCPPCSQSHLNRTPWTLHWSSPCTNGLIEGSTAPWYKFELESLIATFQSVQNFLPHHFPETVSWGSTPVKKRLTLSSVATSVDAFVFYFMNRRQIQAQYTPRTQLFEFWPNKGKSGKSLFLNDEVSDKNGNFWQPFVSLFSNLLPVITAFSNPATRWRSSKPDSCIEFCLKNPFFGPKKTNLGSFGPKNGRKLDRWSADWISQFKGACCITQDTYIFRKCLKVHSVHANFCF